MKEPRKMKFSELVESFQDLIDEGMERWKFTKGKLLYWYILPAGRWYKVYPMDEKGRLLQPRYLTQDTYVTVLFTNPAKTII